MGVLPCRPGALPGAVQQFAPNLRGGQRRELIQGRGTDLGQGMEEPDQRVLQHVVCLQPLPETGEVVFKNSPRQVPQGLVGDAEQLVAGRPVAPAHALQQHVQFR
jgi:hypothetical protein